MCFGELKEAYIFFFWLAPLTPEASATTKKLKIGYSESSSTSTLWAPKTLDLLVVPSDFIEIKKI